MPTKREREYYAMGFRDGQKVHLREDYQVMIGETGGDPFGEVQRIFERPRKKPKRKLSAWNKYVKANSKKPRFRYRNGKLNLKKMAIAFRKTPAGRKKKRR